MATSTSGHESPPTIFTHWTSTASVTLPHMSFFWQMWPQSCLQFEDGMAERLVMHVNDIESAAPTQREPLLVLHRATKFCFEQAMKREEYANYLTFGHDYLLNHYPEDKRPSALSRDLLILVKHHEVSNIFVFLKTVMGALKMSCGQHCGKWYVVHIDTLIDELNQSEPAKFSIHESNTIRVLTALRVTNELLRFLDQCGLCAFHDAEKIQAKMAKPFEDLAARPNTLSENWPTVAKLFRGDAQEGRSSYWVSTITDVRKLNVVAAFLSPSHWDKFIEKIDMLANLERHLSDPEALARRLCTPAILTLLLAPIHSGHIERNLQHGALESRAVNGDLALLATLEPWRHRVLRLLSQVPVLYESWSQDISLQFKRVPAHQPSQPTSGLLAQTGANLTLPRQIDADDDAAIQAINSFKKAVCTHILRVLLLSRHRPWYHALETARHDASEYVKHARDTINENVMKSRISSDTRDFYLSILAHQHYAGPTIFMEESKPKPLLLPGQPMTPLGKVPIMFKGRSGEQLYITKVVESQSLQLRKELGSTIAMLNQTAGTWPAPNLPLSLASAHEESADVSQSSVETMSVRNMARHILIDLVGTHAWLGAFDQWSRQACEWHGIKPLDKHFAAFFLSWSKRSVVKSGTEIDKEWIRNMSHELGVFYDALMGMPWMVLATCSEDTRLNELLFKLDAQLRVADQALYMVNRVNQNMMGFRGLQKSVEVLKKDTKNVLYPDIEFRAMIKLMEGLLVS